MALVEPRRNAMSATPPMGTALLGEENICRIKTSRLQGG